MTESEITTEEWLRRCADQYIRKSGISQNIADECARACFESDDPLFKQTPEEAADSDMECWDDDGGEE